MNIIKSALFVSLSATAFAAGCNKNDSTPPANTVAPTSSPAAASTLTPSAVTPVPAAAAATAVSEVAGTYSAVSDVNDAAGHPTGKRHQTLTLNADGTAELNTKVLKTPTATTTESSDVGTGTFTAGPKEVKITFTLKNGKPLPASDTMRALIMTRDPGGKALTGEDGRTFEKAK